MQASRARPLRLGIACLFALGASAACGEGTIPVTTTAMHITVSSTEVTNDNRPLHCMVRVVEPEVAMVEDYDQAAALVFSDDDTLLARDVVFPGRPFELDVTLDPTQAIAVYFFFTDPSDAWVVPIPAPLPARLAIELGENEVATWEPRAGAGAQAASSPGEFVVPPVGGAPPNVAAPALPAMPEAPELEAPAAPQAPRLGR